MSKWAICNDSSVWCEDGKCLAFNSRREAREKLREIKKYECLHGENFRVESLSEKELDL